MARKARGKDKGSGAARSGSKASPKIKARAPGAIEVLYESLTADGVVHRANSVVDAPGPQLTAIATEKRTYHGKPGARFVGKPKAVDPEAE